MSKVRVPPNPNYVAEVIVLLTSLGAKRTEWNSGRMACDLLETKRAHRKVIDVNLDARAGRDNGEEQAIERLQARNQMHWTDGGELPLPQIFVDGFFLGDTTALQELEDDGLLGRMLRRQLCLKCHSKKSGKAMTCPNCGAEYEEIIPDKLTIQGELRTYYGVYSKEDAAEEDTDSGSEADDRLSAFERAQQATPLPTRQAPWKERATRVRDKAAAKRGKRRPTAVHGFRRVRCTTVLTSAPILAAAAEVEAAEQEEWDEEEWEEWDANAEEEEWADEEWPAEAEAGGEAARVEEAAAPAGEGAPTSAEVAPAPSEAAPTSSQDVAVPDNNVAVPDNNVAVPDNDVAVAKDSGAPPESNEPAPTPSEAPPKQSAAAAAKGEAAVAQSQAAAAQGPAAVAQGQPAASRGESGAVHGEAASAKAEAPRQKPPAPVQPPAAPKPLPVLEGHLFKKSPNQLRFWAYEKRYFTLRNMQLCWYKTKQDALTADPRGRQQLCKGFIDMTAGKVEIQLQMGNETTFVLAPVSGTWAPGAIAKGDAGRAFTLDTADSEHTRDKWVGAISEHIRRAAKQIRPKGSETVVADRDFYSALGLAPPPAGRKK